MGSESYIAASGASAQLRGLDVVANNLANVGTPGFKRAESIFRSVLESALRTEAGAAVPGGQATAFLHYFSENEITSLLEEAGMEVRDIHHVGYTVKPGDILENRDEGALFVIADRPKE